MTTTLAPALTGNQIAGIKRSKAFGPLKPAFEILTTTGGFSEVDALVRLGLATAAPADPDAERVAALVATGKFTEAQARGIVAAAAQPQHFTPTAVAAPAAAPAAKAEPVTSKTQADALVAQQGLKHGKGRVYVTGSILESAARVLKNGAPEVIATSGVGRTTHVVIFREDSGDVAIQNLYRPV